MGGSTVSGRPTSGSRHRARPGEVIVTTRVREF